MNRQERGYILTLSVEDVPWHRLTTAYGRAADFPAHFAVLRKMDDLQAAENSLEELTCGMEHQGTLWHAAPFGTVFLCRVLRQAFAESGRNETARFIAGSLVDFFAVILECFRSGDEMEHADPLPFFADMLKEEYLWSEEYDEEEDEMRYEEEDVFPDDLFYSFYYYSYQAILAYREIFNEAPEEFAPQAKEILAQLKE